MESLLEARHRLRQIEVGKSVRAMGVEGKTKDGGLFGGSGLPWAILWKRAHFCPLLYISGLNVQLASPWLGYSQTVPK